MPKFNWVLSKAKFWKNMPPTSRPWSEEVKVFEKYAIAKKRHGQIDALILGATVEFRSLLHQHGLNVNMVDFSKKFVDIISKQPMKYKGAETLYEQNWLKLKLPKKYDLIFGDWVPGVLHTKFYKKFFNNITQYLKTDGLFIIRTGLRLSDQTVNLRKIILEHYKKHAELPLYTSIAHHIYGYNADPETSIGKMQAALEEIKNLNQQGYIKKKDFDFLMLAYSKEGADASLMVKNKFENELKKYFKIWRVHHPKIYTTRWFPIYVLGKHVK